MSCTSTLLLLLSLALNRAVTAVQCFVGTNSARKISVEEPYCSFSITYKNDHCDSRPEVVLTDHGNPISDLSPFGVESLCYHTDNSVTCLCFGHLCNDQFNQKEILAMELLKPSSDPRLRRIIVCYLLNNHAHDVFSAKNFEVTASTQEDLSATKLSNTRTPFKGAGRNQNADDKKKPNGTPMKRDSEQESEIDIFLALGGVIAAVFVFALVVILIVIILASKKKKTPKKPKKSKNIKDKAPPPTSDERTSERSTRWSQEAVRTSPSVEYNKLTYGMPGYSDNIGLSRHTLPDRALGIREDQEGYVLRSDAEIKRMKRQQARELRRVEQEFLSLSERDSDYDLEDGQRRRRDDSI